MYFVTYDKNGLLQHLRTSEAQCAGSFGYSPITSIEADTLKIEGEFHKWRMDMSTKTLYRLPDCDPKYHVTVNGRVVEMSDEQKAALDAQQAPPVDLEAMKVRKDRNGRLAACDWTQLIDSPISNDTRTAWQAYRQALRDITLQAGFPSEITWPEQP